MNQTYSSLEIILVDDGSTDCSGEICDKCAREDSRIRVIHQTNSGLVCARKSGLKIATGQYIGFVDGDDYIELDMYEKMYKLMQKHHVDFVHCRHIINDYGRIISGNRNGIISFNKNELAYQISEFIFGYTTDPCMVPSICVKLFKTELIRESYAQVPDSADYGEDLICLCNCIMKNPKVFITDEPYYHYVIRDKSINHDTDILSLAKIGNLYATLQELFKKYEIWNLVGDAINNYYLYNLIKKMNTTISQHTSLYSFPCINILIGKKTVLYGAGSVGMDYYNQIRKYMKCELIAWVDKNYDKYKFEYCEVLDPTIINKCEYDIVLIGVAQEKIAREIKRELIEMGISEEKIIWKCPIKAYQVSY